MRQAQTVTTFFAGGVLIAAGWTFLLQLAPIPHSMAVNVPPELQCEFYGSWRYRWGCAQFGDVFSNPWPSLIGLLASVTAVTALRLTSAFPISGIALLAMQIGSFSTLSVLLRILSFLTGHATVSYLVWTLAPLCIALLSFLVLWRSLRHLPYGRYSNHERLRKVNLARSIELEVSERVAKKYERK